MAHRPAVTVESVDELIASLQRLRAKLMRLGIHDPSGYVPPGLEEPRLQSGHRPSPNRRYRTKSR